VIRVTSRGGILINDDRGFETWLAYNHVRVVDHIRRRPTCGQPRHDQRAVRDILQRVVVERGRAAAARVLTRDGRIRHVRDLLPQDYDPVYQACERELSA
jgi:hypothetical protein